MKIAISGRIDEFISSTVNHICNESKLSKSDFIELACIELICKWEKNLIYEGVDFKEYSKSVKLSRLRRIIGKERNEFLSKTLMMPRINTDILKMVIVKKNKEELVNLISHYLSIRKKEAFHYKDNEDILKEIKQLETKMNKNTITDFKNFLMDRVSDIDYLKQATKH